MATRTSPGGALPSDGELIRRVQRGDESALEVLHSRYYTRLFRLAFLSIPSREEAHDIASEAFCRAIREIPRMCPDETRSLFPWLHRVTTRLMIDAYRRAPRRRTVSIDDDTRKELRQLIEQLPNGSPGPAERLLSAELQQVIRDAVAQLPATQGMAISYRFVGGMPIRDIAAAMGNTESAAKSLLHRAIVALRERLTGTADRPKRGLSRTTVPAARARGRQQDVSGRALRIHR